MVGLSFGPSTPIVPNIGWGVMSIGYAVSGAGVGVPTVAVGVLPETFAGRYAASLWICVVGDSASGWVRSVSSLFTRVGVGSARLGVKVLGPAVAALVGEVKQEKKARLR